MAVRSILLHRPGADNANNFADAGDTLLVGDGAEAGMIAPALAQALIDSDGAVFTAPVDVADDAPAAPPSVEHEAQD